MVSYVIACELDPRSRRTRHHTLYISGGYLVVGGALKDKGAWAGGVLVVPIYLITQVLAFDPDLQLTCMRVTLLPDARVRELIKYFCYKKSLIFPENTHIESPWEFKRK